MTTAFIYPDEKIFPRREPRRFAPARGEAPKRSAVRVLFVTEDQQQFDRLRAHCADLRHGTNAAHWLANYETAREALFREAYDVVVLDHRHHGLELLRDMARAGTDTPAVVLVDDPTLTRDAAGVICEFLARDAIDAGRLQRAIDDVVRRASDTRAAARSQMWWRSGGRTLSHATAFPAPPDSHGNVFLNASVPDAPPYQVNVSRQGDGRFTRHDELASDLLNSLPGVIVVQLDPDGTILDCKGSGLAATGLTLETLRGQNILNFPGVPATAIRQAAHGTPVKFLRSWMSHGRARHFECHLRFDPQRRGGVVCIAWDVTERVEAERTHEQHEHLFAGILRQLPAMAGRLDEAGKISEIHDEGLRARGIDPDSMLGAKFADVFPQAAKAVECALSGGALRMEAVVHRDGAAEWRAEFSVFSDRAHTGGAMFFVQDITERRGFERQIVEAVDAERQRIGADLHDDVGQLLTGITCLSTALVERLRGRDDLAAEDAATVANVAQEALTHIRALARGLAPTRRSQPGLSGALEDLREQLRRMQDVDLRLELGTEEFDHETTAHLLRIVQEATSNAIRHGEAKQIEVSLRRVASQLTLTIADNGCGFDPQQRSRTGGSGLGLMEYRAALIGGRVTISSAPLHGTRIEILFNPSQPCPHENAC